MHRKTALTLLLACLYLCPLFSQVPKKNFDPDSLSNNFFTRLKKEYGKNKQYPPQFEKQILLALSYYPELKNTAIKFRTRIRHTTVETRATWAGVFQSRQKRHFVVTISDSTESMLMPLAFKHLSFNEQVGVMGHELGHVTDFSRMTSFQIIEHAVKNVSAKYIDQFEYNTDAICIAHGLGYQLLDWSSFIRKKMNTVNWDGPDYAHRPKKRERYMNPSTIEKRISVDPIYKSLLN
jgi:hypothetical protein